MANAKGEAESGVILILPPLGEGGAKRRMRAWREPGNAEPAVCFEFKCSSSEFGSLGFAKPASALRAPSPDGGRTHIFGLVQQAQLRKSFAMKFTPGKTLKRARALRANETEAESRLWARLRNRNLNGFKFTRQVPIAPYIADFLCFEKKLIVEVDGDTHGDADEVTYDERRTQFLEARGYRVLRVWNHEVYTQLDGVLEGILHKLEEI